MQNKVIGVVVFLAIGVVLTGLMSGSWADLNPFTYSGAEGSGDNFWTLCGMVLTALGVGNLAMGLYSSGGVSSADAKSCALLVIVGMVVSGGYPLDNGWAALALAWILVGGLRT
ncbi:MAG TPA: hypothetical protein EYN79_10955 [Planctomycetes bacterium]|nr:hypothetical protein [Planctomycetota bacterium]